MRQNYLIICYFKFPFSIYRYLFINLLHTFSVLRYINTNTFKHIYKNINISVIKLSIEIQMCLCLGRQG